MFHTCIMAFSLFFTTLISLIALSASKDKCGSTATPITPFDLKEYLGIWYQIAVNKGFEQLFERRYPLCIYANYTRKGNDSVSVLNTGFNDKGDKNVATGVATQPTPNNGGLQVSFYGFPSSPYNIIK